VPEGFKPENNHSHSRMRVADSPNAWDVSGGSLSVVIHSHTHTKWGMQARAMSGDVGLASPVCTYMMGTQTESGNPAPTWEPAAAGSSCSRPSSSSGDLARLLEASRCDDCIFGAPWVGVHSLMVAVLDSSRPLLCSLA
jgi:hypothetical protein